MIVQSIDLIYQIWKEYILSKSILISKFISNTSYQMKYDIDIDIDIIVLTTIIDSFNYWFAPDQQE